MDRRRGLVIVVTVFGLIALTLAAATLTDPTVNTGGGGKFGFSGNGTGGLFSGADNQSSVDVVVPPGVLPVFQVLAVALTLLAVVVAFRTFSWSDLARVILAVIAVLFGWLLVTLLELLAGSFERSGGVRPAGICFPGCPGGLLRPQSGRATVDQSSGGHRHRAIVLFRAAPAIGLAGPNSSAHCCCC